MAETSTPPAETSALFSYLKIQTSPRHRQLERHLGLLNPPVARERLVRVLRRFLSFHRGWEPAMQAYPGFAQLMASRSRIGLAERDLIALGESPAELLHLAPCPLAPEMLSDEARAMGSLYVMEGSTLGGEFIGRVIAKQDWAPADSLSYFTPPVRNVREDWLELQRWSERRWSASAWPAIAEGAGRTFEFLDTWLN